MEENNPTKKASKTKDKAEVKRLAKIEECLASQGYELQRFNKFLLYAKLVVPENYKEPKFVSKYDGTGCPKNHLKYSLHNMVRYLDNAPLLISTFQDSLRGAALTWYIALNIEDFIEWDHLTGEFFR